MILSPIPRIEVLHMAVVVDLDVGLARQSFKRVGWADGRYDARSGWRQLIRLAYLRNVYEANSRA